ncbi:MAG: hypothetical protein A3I68_06385 [Candidatus Melainabacteria bacterium RIFCSPLOWO2_02_FULL_35_15]|nr:MAG: hypothetical protein A3F80_08040 [Candidatus Melainabacteria bacterium RIFCSPLOWO2_12_FULL_35_11]OGI14592.1 MAG: hypothetical protein A3I68_06385 [Candidatus Melainabacteria bacterium RIFCSPLOWO2_02_FULL_35_15]
MLIALSISLQCNISVCAQIEENNKVIVVEEENSDNSDNADADAEVIEGTSISSRADDQQEEYLSN